MAKAAGIKKSLTAKRSTKLVESLPPDNAALAKAVKKLASRVSALEDQQAAMLEQFSELVTTLQAQAQAHNEAQTSASGLANEVRAFLNNAEHRNGSRMTPPRGSGTLGSSLGKMADTGAVGIDANARRDVGQQRRGKT